jgi:predicted transcriptional regulator
MQAVWAAHGSVSVREVVEVLNADRPEPLAYTTVMTVMNRLAGKDALVRHPAGRSYVYEAAAANQAGLAVKKVIRAYGDEAITHFLDEARSDPKMLSRLQRLFETE